MKKAGAIFGWLGLWGIILWGTPGLTDYAATVLSGGLQRPLPTGNNLAREKKSLFISHEAQDSAKLPDPRHPAEDYFQAGQACMATGDFQSARQNFTRYLQLNQVRMDSDVDLANLISLGVACEALKDPEFAMGYFQLATFVCLQQWGMLPPSQSCNFFGGKAASVRRLEPFEGLVRLSFAQQDFLGAFDWSETIHTLMMWDKGNCPDPRDPKDLPKTKDAMIKDQIVLTYQKMKMALDQKDRKLFLSLKSEIDHLQKDWGRATVQLRRKYSQYYSQFYGKPQKAGNIPLHSYEALIKYQITASKTFAWLLQDHRIVKTKVIPLSRKELEEKIKNYLGTLAKVDRGDPRLGAELHRLLIEGLMPTSVKVQKLIIIPDGILFDVPFDILLYHPQPDGDHVKAGETLGPSNIAVIEYYRSANEFQSRRQK